MTFQRLSTVAAAALTAGLLTTGTASAAVMASIIDWSTQGVGNDADVFAAGYSGLTPSIATWDGTDEPLVTPPPGSVGSIYKTPFDNTSISETRTYFSVGAEEAVSGDGSPSPRTLTFAKVISSFKMLWGSIDDYNKVVFDIAGASTTYTGTDIKALIGDPSFESVALVEFTGDFSTITFFSENSGGGDIAALEFAFAPVPVPAAGLLLLTAVGGIAALRRRKTA